MIPMILFAFSLGSVPVLGQMFHSPGCPFPLQSGVSYICTTTVYPVKTVQLK